MVRDQRIAYLEKTIIDSKNDLNKIEAKITQLSSERDSLLVTYEQLTKIEERRLQTIEEQDLPDLRKDKDRLAEELVDNRKEQNTLRIPTVQTEKGICNPILNLSYPILSYPNLSLFYPILSYPILSLFYPILSYPILSYPSIYLFIYLGLKRNQYSLEEFLNELHKKNNVDVLSFKDPKFDTFERILQPSFIDMPKVDRDDVVETFWDNVNTFIDRKEIFFIQGSPGCGKTYALREIGRDSRTKGKSHYVCVGVSFSSLTSVTNN
jgi:hypothetical protein